MHHPGGTMDEGVDIITFLGLPSHIGPHDVSIVPLAFELTTSYGTGTQDGPTACLVASAQVELFDDLLGAELPDNSVISTQPVWEGSAPTLRGQLDQLEAHASRFFSGEVFPLFLGGEHGILPPIARAARFHPLVSGDLESLTIVQIDAHADLRSSLDGEVFSHACAASRSLDVGVGRVVQAGVRAYCQEEFERINTDSRISTFFAKDTQHPHTGRERWEGWLNELRSLSGPVHLSLDIDGLEGALVPATGTPVPGGLSYWQVIESIEVLFANPNVVVISSDINEIVPQNDTPLTEFTAACLAAKTVACHLLSKKEGRWYQTERETEVPVSGSYFEDFQAAPVSTSRRE